MPRKTSSDTDFTLGILMLETNFPRLLGDIGNPQTFTCPVLYETIPAANFRTVIQQDPHHLLPVFKQAAQRLVARGAHVVTTSCGFLGAMQAELTAAVDVPVLTSSLLQVPWVRTLLPAARNELGIITIARASLTSAVLRQCGVPDDVAIAGIDTSSELYRVISGDLPELSPQAATHTVLAAADHLLDAQPQLGAIVLECTNLSPYAAALRKHVDIPVFDIIGLLAWMHDAYGHTRKTAE